MPSIKLSALVLATLMFVTSYAYADDLDVTMDVIDSNSSAVDNLMNRIELPTQTSEKAHEAQADSEHGSDTANEARERTAERLDGNGRSEESADNANEHADLASDKSNEHADVAADKANEHADMAGANASERASDASDNAKGNADLAGDKANEHAHMAGENASDRAKEMRKQH